MLIGAEIAESNLRIFRKDKYMKKIGIMIMLLATSLMFAEDLKIGSFNILGTYPENAEFSDERAKFAADLVEYRDFDVVGLQEAQLWQVDAMLKSGTFEKSGLTVSGEVQNGKNWWGNIIIYKKKKFELVESGSFYLTDTPDQLSKPDKWGEKQYRNCNWVKLRIKKSGKEFFFFNTHFGLTPTSRVNMAKVFVAQIQKIAGDNIFFCSGDFNTVATEKATLDALLGSKYLFDSWKISKLAPYGPKGSFVCMVYNRRINGSNEVDNPWRKLDYLFVSKGVKVLKCAVISDNVGGAYPSDHLPLEAYVKF